MQVVHITANSRLTATFKQQTVLSAQQNVVQTPKVMTLAQWWQEWQSTSLLTGQLKPEMLPSKILNAFEAQWLFEQTLQLELDKRSNAKANDETADKEIALLNIHTTAKQLYQAWSLLAEWIEDWQEDGFMLTSFDSQETYLFKTVLSAYLDKLKTKNWSDEVLFSLQRLQWLQQGISKNQLASQFQLHGFDDLSPNTRRWWQSLEYFDCKVSDDKSEPQTEESPGLVDLSIQHDDLSCYPAQDLFDEVQQVSLWALQQIAQLKKQKPYEQIRVAVVAPNVAEYKTALTQCLDEQIYQNGLGSLHSQAVATESRQNTKLYNLSLGESLFSVSIIENAWQTLNLFLQPNRTTAYQTWSEWLISPYTLGDFTQRQQADAQFRRLQWANVLWPNLLENKASKSLPKPLFKAVNDWQSQFAEISQTKVSLVVFIDQAWLLLDALNWPGNRTLNSDEYQQKTAFENALTQFSKLADIGGKQSYGNWLNLLKRYLSEQVHQSQSVGHQPIQIMGMLEAGGQTFDALWVLGLTNEAWPRMPNPNPFIPMFLQRQAGLPRSDASRELVYAQQVSQRLVESSKHVVWSYPQQTGEATLLPCSILPGLENDEVAHWQAQPYLTLAQRLYETDSTAVEWVEDFQGAEVPNGSAAPGGTGILQAQSQCPLMAYIDFRLGAKYGFQEVEDSLQNTNQGTLIHAVLEYFWQETKTQVALLSLSEEQKIARLIQHIETAFAELQGGLAQGILVVEQARILELCLQWLDLESKRASFAVQETEDEHLIELASIKFKVIIDRIDQVNGQAIILDYKTGKASINRLLETPLAAPQLAVYLMGMKEDVTGIGYALLHSDDGVKFSAVTQDEGALPKSRSVQIFSKLAEKENGEYFESTWDEFLQHLRQQVLELAEQIQQGAAQMTFDKVGDVQYAAGYLALRMPEVLAQMQNSADFNEEQA